jgi:hypothetical protein
MKRGPWIGQHDVDILDDHRIGVYDNAAEDRGHGPYFANSSQIIVYDFATDEVSRPLELAMRYNKVRTVDDALFTRLPNGSWMIEGSREATLIIFRPDGRIAAQFVNRAKNGLVYHLGWSRYIDKPEGDVILGNLRKAGCHA